MNKLFERHPESYQLINELTFCVFDLETTGGNHKNDKIIEIGLVKIKNLEIVDKKEFLINPEIKIPEFIQKLTNIKQADVENAQKIEEVIHEIVEFMGDSILVAHNISFDIPFFNSVLRRLDMKEVENKSLCTNLMTKYLIPDLLNSNLNYMSRIFGIRHKKAHRALDDAMATAELLIKYFHIYISKGIKKINHLYYPRNRFELDRYHFKSDATDKEQLEEILEKLSNVQTSHLVTLKGENGVILFSLPCTGHPDEKKLLSEKLKEFPWETTTIKIFGPFIEALVKYNNLYTKIDPNLRGEIFQFLWKTHLPHKKMPSRETDLAHEQVLTRDFGDFLIVNHLVPEQMIVYPVQALHVKTQLVFRYPGHKKKLLQFINSKSQRLSNNKLKPAHYHPLLKNFIDNYLLDIKEKEGDIFIFKKSLPLQRPDEFITRLNDFLTKHPNPNKYPKEYI
tara:strand:+ start:44719 stop:46074 length:1356 start_codon:yes stop_codon:yes gene_type:complete